MCSVHEKLMHLLCQDDHFTARLPRLIMLFVVMQYSQSVIVRVNILEKQRHPSSLSKMKEGVPTNDVFVQSRCTKAAEML